MDNERKFIDEELSFIIEEKIIHHLILKGFSLKDIGLFGGKAGIAIAFFCYGKYTRNNTYIEVADDLIDGFLSQVDKRTGIDFATGLCGVGWAIEFFIQNNFVVCDSNQACIDIDRLVMLADVRRISDVSLKTGLEGLLHYVLARLKGAMNQNNAIPFDKQYLEDLHGKLLSIDPTLISEDFSLLIEEFDSFMNKGIFSYELKIELFIECVEFEEKDINHARLGLNNGLAGILAKLIKSENLN